MIDGRGEGGALYLGIEIGGTKLQICAGNSQAQILERQRWEIAVADGAGGIRAQLSQSLPEMAGRLRPAAIGVGFGGPVEWKTGRICCSHQIKGWSDFPLGSWISEMTQAPVFVDNDANVAALGEAVHGAGKGRNPAFYVTLGSGVGGGLVAAGKIFHGAPPGETEIGHVRLDRAGTTLESRCSGWAVDAKIRSASAAHPQSSLARAAGTAGRGEARFLASALQQQDPLAKAILDETSEDLAFGLSHVVHLFHPEVIVLGGGLAFVGEPLRAAVEQFLRGYIMEAFAPGPGIVLTRLAADAVPVGALALASALQNV
jgi:glucokinase